MTVREGQEGRTERTRREGNGWTRKEKETAREEDLTLRY